MENLMFKSLWNMLTGSGSIKDIVKIATVSEAELKKMTKKQIDDWAVNAGVTLDRRLTKDKMIAELKTHKSQVNIT
jgi:hypothetical protein